MRLHALLLTTTLLPLTASSLCQTKPFTLQQVLSAPYATQLTAAPVGDLFAWVEDSEGRHNLWVAGPNTPARQLTHNTLDDGLDLTGLTWSPDATAIAYTYGTEAGADGKPSNPAHLQRTVEPQVIVQPVAPGAKAILIGAGRTPLFDPLNHQLFFIRAGQIWSAPLGASCSSEGGGCQTEVQSSDIHQLVFDRGNASSLAISPDGHTLAFISTRRETNQPAHHFLALFDLNTHTLTFPAPSTGNDSAPAWSPDGKQLAWLRAPFTQTPEYTPRRTSPNPWSIQLLNLMRPITTAGFEGAGLQPRRNAAPGEAGALAPGGNPRTIFTPSPNQPGSVLPHMATGEPRLLWTADNRLIFPSEANGWLHLYSIDAQSPGAPRLLTPGKYEVEDPTLSTDREYLLYASNDDTAGGTTDPLDRGRRHIWGIDPTAATPKPLSLTHGPGIETRPTITAKHDVAALVADAHLNMHPALIGMEHLTPLNYPTLPEDYPATALVSPQQVLFSASDGMKLHAQLFLPPNLDPTTKHPAILFLHGGPNRQMLLGYPAMGYYSNAYAMNQYLASRGFIVLSVNYRMGIGYGMDFREAANVGPNGAAEYNDVLAAQKYLASRPDVDPKRIGIWGGSYGGYLTALALARNSNLFAPGVDFHGVHDWNLEDNAGDWLIGNNAEKDAIAARALASSPIGSIAKWTSPVLLIHGDNDANVAYAQTPILADKLRAQGVHVEELIFPDEVHEFELHGDWLKAYEAEAAFFERLLKP